jgi:uncharacterized protein YaiI (UPF0178 family)
MNLGKKMIWVDADACPKVIKEHIFKIVCKQQIPTTLVANSYIQTPLVENIHFVQVAQGADVADSYIVEHVKPDELVITADIPLASLVIEKGAVALNPRGEIYTEESISERLSMRNFMADLRDSGVVTGGPDSFGTKDKANFANAFNRLLVKWD